MLGRRDSKSVATYTGELVAVTGWQRKHTNKVLPGIKPQ